MKKATFALLVVGLSAFLLGASSPTPVFDLVAPYPTAPTCLDVGEAHDHSQFHTLWNSTEGCHYDHEHGTNPFTLEVVATFPGFDLPTLLGSVGIGHTNPSSPMENTHKHGGFKWDVVLANPHGCVGGFEGATYCVVSAVVQYHNFGDYGMEMEARIHSAVALLKVCRPVVPTDCGYLYTVQHEEFGQRITPYQGTVIPYPDNPAPGYASGFGQYFSIDCIYAGLPNCRIDLLQIVSMNLNANSIWTSKPTGMSPKTGGIRPPGSTIFRLLFRVRDNYQVLDSRDLTYPFTFAWICSNDDGVTYNPAACRYNNTTSKVHEVGGTIPAVWDNLAGFDTNPLVGRITADGFTDRFGSLDLTCVAAGGNCFPLKLVNMYVGNYGDYLTPAKAGTNTPATNPERDIYFCNGAVCLEGSPGAVPSGWIGGEN